MYTPNRITLGFRIVMGGLLLLLSMFSPTRVHAAAILIDIPGPPGSGRFGSSVAVLANGNFVVTDPDYGNGSGAVYLYSPDRVLISRITGDGISGRVGGGGIAVLINGSFVILSPGWTLATPTSVKFSVGAVTWCSGITGCSGIVSASNSLIGSQQGDQVGSGGVIALANGNYVVRTPGWNNGIVAHAGAVTWGNGAGGTAGPVSPSNSLVGSTQNDQVGYDSAGGVIALQNGNYLVISPSWDNGSAVDAGAITWGNGAGGTAGPVTAANSLVGSTSNDRVGGSPHNKIFELTNGNYVVYTYQWGPDAAHRSVGAVTWGSSTQGVSGPISTSNSLVGISPSAPVGDVYSENRGVTVLTNGNYVVSSPFWDPDGTGTGGYWGAVTWGSGAVGVAGQPSVLNSLVGSHEIDYVGTEVIALTNGNYVVKSPDWDCDSAIPNCGAVTWGNGTTGATTGPVSAFNSLVGHSLVGVGGGGVIALANGNYAVSSPAWYDDPLGLVNVGAVTWGDGTTGTTGPVSTANSLMGDSFYESIGNHGLVALANGNYVVITLSGGDVLQIGSVTWVDGSHATTGVVSDANSLVGSTTGDQVGSGVFGGGVTPLTNGNYVVRSPHWDNGSITDAGAITWGNGASGTMGVVSASNSLMGSSADDQLGSDFWYGGVFALTNGNYVVSIPQWDNGDIADAGAVAWENGASGTAGPVSAANSLVGSATGDLVGDGSYFGAAGVTPLADGNYIVNSPHWSNAAAVGAVTWGDGTSGTLGTLSASNSLVNTSANDQTFSKSIITTLPDGKISILFPNWSDGISNGAVSLVAGLPNLTFGPVSTANSILGSAQLGGGSMVSGYDASRAQLVVGRPEDNKVTILCWRANPTHWFYLPAIRK